MVLQYLIDTNLVVGFVLAVESRLEATFDQEAVSHLGARFRLKFSIG